MELSRLFKLGIEAGRLGDARSNEEIEKSLLEEKEKYEKLEGKEKEFYDTDRLFNPYLDSAIYFDSKKEIKKIFIGIDAEVQELLLADKLGVDLVLGHHPEGKALLNLWEVLTLHQESLIKSGLPVNIAERLVDERKAELSRALHGQNYNRAVDASKLLNLSFANLHTPADNLANKFMEDYLVEHKVKKVKDILECVLELEEYKITAKNTLKPKVVSGIKGNRVGKIFVKFNGGTSGNKKMFKHLENVGVSTFICMHLPEEQIKEAKKHNITVIIMPHMASDSLGMNLMIAEIEKNGNEKFDIIEGSGFIRINRSK